MAHTFNYTILTSILKALGWRRKKTRGDLPFAHAQFARGL
jgi:hypothetical protein